MLTTFLSRMLRVAGVPCAAIALLACLGCGSKDTEPVAQTTSQPEAPQTLTEELPRGVEPQLAGMPAPADDSTIVTVDGTALTRAELEQSIDRMMQSGQARNIPPQFQAQARQQMQQQAVQQFVVRTLLTDEAERQSITVTEEERTEMLERIASQLPEGVTLEDAARQAGGSVDQLKSEIEDEIRVRKLVESQIPQPEPATAEEIEAFYESQRQRFEAPERVHARHILLKVEEDANDDAHAAARAKMAGYLTQLEEGADFAALAREHSDCPSASEGGDLGTFARGQMVPPFEQAAFGQPVGEVGDIVKTDFGYHIIEVLEREEASVESLDEVKEQIGDHLTQQQQQSAMRDYLETLRAKADIQFAESL